LFAVGTVSRIASKRFNRASRAARSPAAVKSATYFAAPLNREEFVERIHDTTRAGRLLFVAEDCATDAHEA
jgi:hypothetical protein